MAAKQCRAVREEERLSQAAILSLQSVMRRRSAQRIVADAIHNKQQADAARRLQRAWRRYKLRTVIHMAKQDTLLVGIPAFRPLPGTFVFPNLPILAFWLLGTGLVRRATSVLMYQATRDSSQPVCGWGCTLLAVVVLLAVLSVLLTVMVILIHFHRHHCKLSWQPAGIPMASREVDDPLYRALSRAKLACRKVLSCSSKSNRLQATQRVRGKWGKHYDDVAEPARTERLLAQPLLVPFALHSARGSDCLESLALTNLNGKTSGQTLLGLMFHWSSMAVQIAVGVLSGVGPYLDEASWPATSQVGTITGIKLTWATILLCCRPCACNLTNDVVALQFMVEGSAGLALLIATINGDEQLLSNVQGITFYLQLSPVFLPALQKFYDGVVVNVIKHCVRNKFDWFVAVATALTFLFAIPALVLRVVGLSGGDGGDEVGTAASSLTGKMGATTKAFMADAKRLVSIRKTTMASQRLSRTRAGTSRNVVVNDNGDDVAAGGDDGGDAAGD